MADRRSGGPGPGSLEVLRYVKSLGDSVRLVLGNHDLHLLAVFAGISRNKPKDRLKPLLEAPDADELLNWLRRQPLLQVDEEKKLVMAHAGITPQWDLETAQQCARDVEAVLSSDSYPFFLDAMYGDMPNHWSNELSGWRACALSLTPLPACATVSRTASWICIRRKRPRTPRRR